MNKKFKQKIFSSLALISVIAALLCISVFGAPTVKVGFAFSKNLVDYARTSKNQPIQYIAVVVPNVQDLDCYKVEYYRTQKGDGTVLKEPEAGIAAPSQSGVYKAIITFNEDCEHYCDNGKKFKEYPAALTIRRVHQDTPQLKSRSADLVQNGDGKSANIAVGKQGIISTFWTSGVKPQYSWSAGSNKVLQLEDGKPARFTALAVGEATLSVMLPEDNNHFQSEISTYKVTVLAENEAAGGYEIKGDKKNENGWFTGDVEIVGVKGFDSLEITGSNPVTVDGTTLVSVAHKAQDGTVSSPQSVTIKRDATPATITVTVNDKPYTDVPFAESAWAADKSFVVKADITDEASGLGRVEYKVDDADYVTDANAVFAQEGTKSFPYSHTFASGGSHTLYLRVEDFAGNITEQSVILGDKTDIATPVNAVNSDSVANSIPSAPIPSTEYEAPDQPTDAMNELSSRLKYLIRCDINPIVAGDVRANAGYINKTYEMFKALTPGERKGLGEETLAHLKKYFTAVLMQSGIDTAEIEQYYNFTVPKEEQLPQEVESTPPASVSSLPSAPSTSVPNSEELANEQKIPQASSAVQAKPNKTDFPLIYLVPIAVFITALVGYFVWVRHSNAPPKTPQNNENTGEGENNAFSGLDQTQNHTDDDLY